MESGEVTRLGAGPYVRCGQFLYRKTPEILEEKM
jgi:hypothetical protein